jgi:hypothetical protein
MSLQNIITGKLELRIAYDYPTVKQNHIGY